MDKFSMILEKLDRVKKTGSDSAKSACPVPEHGKGRGDKHRSFHITRKNDGKILIHCFADCTTQEVVDALGIRMSDLFPKSEECSR